MSRAREPIALIGSGAFGRALAELVTRAGTQVHVGDDLGALAARARLIVLAVSSRRASEVVPALGPHVTGAHLIVHATGALVGRDPGDDGVPSLRVSELIRRECASRRIGVIAGPALARDLAAGRPAALVVASPVREVVVAVQTALSAPPSLRVYGSADLIGAELAAAAAGAYTLGLGLVDALALGDGPRALLVTRATTEAARLVVACGGHAATVSGLAGLGNLLVRSSEGSSEGSDDYQAGRHLGRGDAPARPSEGLRSLPALVGLAEHKRVRAPILVALHAAASRRLPVDRAIAGLLETHADDE
jgi:glycerol-3-phosphate dehydrogenase (NAD(P)+)